MAGTRRETLEGLWRSWVLWVTLAETTGFAVPAIVGVTTRDAPGLVAFVGLVLAGLVEGAALGWGQAHVLVRGLPALDQARFVRLTSLGAAGAYAVAMVAVLAGEWLAGLPWIVVAVVGAALGAALLASIGSAQWLELRSLVPRAATWIVTTAAAWVVGLGVFFLLATPLWYEGQPVAATIAVGVGAGLVMAASVAALTGLAMVRLVRRVRPAADDADDTASSLASQSSSG